MADEAACAKRPRAISFVGRSGSGKTVLTEQVIAKIVARGIKVGTLKHHGHKGFDIDREGKDSWRHRQAGSSHVVVASPDMVASYRDVEADLGVEKLLEEFDDVDLVIVEGYRGSSLPTIIVGRAANPREATNPSTLEGVNLVGVVSDIESLRAEGASRGVPTADLNDVDAVVDMVLSITGVEELV